jgi:ankyrin repeat protein
MQHTALYKAAKRGDVIAVRRLLSDGSDPNGAPTNDTPLVAAAARGNTPIIRLLLDAGAKPDWHALQVAAFSNHPEAVRLLLAAGAPVDAGDGGTPLLNALKSSGAPLERQERVRQLLRDAGARELSERYLQWRWSLRYGWRWRLRRLLYSTIWRPRRRKRDSH